MPYFINGPLTAVLVVVGTWLNGLTVYVLTMRGLTGHDRTYSMRGASFRRSDHGNGIHHGQSTRPRIYIYLLWMSYIDTTLLISALLMYCVPALLNGTMGAYIHFFPFYYLLSNTVLTASVWLMCALMFDRYRTLCSPLTARPMTYNEIHRSLFITCIMALCFSFPRYFELDVLPLEEIGSYYLTQTHLVNNQVYMIGYRIVGGLLFYSLLPYVVLFAMSFRIWIVLRKAAKTRIKMAAKQNTSGQTDSEKILLCVMAKFLCSRLMPTALDVAEHAIGSSDFQDSSEATMCVDISNLIVVASSSMNFIFFYVFSCTFRHRLWRTSSTFSVCETQSQGFAGNNKSFRASNYSSPKAPKSPSLLVPPQHSRASPEPSSVHLDPLQKPYRGQIETKQASDNDDDDVKCICYNL